MSKNDRNEPDAVDDIAAILDDALEASKTGDAEQRARRRWFGISYIGLGIFCGAIAAIPWPGKALFDTVMWILGGLAMLFVGAWNVDRAAVGAKVRSNTRRLGESGADQAVGDPPIRRVK